MKQKLLKLNRKLKNFIHMPFRDKLLFLIAFILSGVARALMIAVPFKKFQPYIGISKEESPYDEMGEQDWRTVKKVRKISLLACEHTPWESKCLVRALVVNWLLRHYKIPTTLYLGVAKDKNKNMLAHAWLRCGKYIVTGGEVQKDFVEVARFSNYKWIERSCEKDAV